MNLKHLTDKTLLIETKRLAHREREITTEILHHLKEVERRKLFSDLGYPSMVAYAIKELNYSESSANKRVQAARLLADIPEIEDKINEGVLSLSNLNKVSGFFRSEEIKTPEGKREVLKQIENKTTRECEKTLQTLGPEKPLPKETIKIVSPEYTQIKVNLCEATLKALHEARQLLGKSLLDDKYFKILSEHALINIKREKFKMTPKGRVTTSETRYVTHSQKREIAEKSNCVCENCGSLFMLQFDHRDPFALGGKSELSNLRLLCFHCNQRARIRARL